MPDRLQLESSNCEWPVPRVPPVLFACVCVCVCDYVTKELRVIVHVSRRLGPLLFAGGEKGSGLD